MKLNYFKKMILIEKIIAEAKAAAQKYADIKDACPYPFYSDEGHAFKQFFLEEKTKQEAEKCNP
jgi:hypothetical protein